MVFKNSEEKRNTAWRTVMTVSSVLIVIIAAFFVIKLFTGNPLEGTWVSEDQGIRMEVREDGTAVLTGISDEKSGGSVTLDINVDKKNKTYTVQQQNADRPDKTDSADPEEDDFLKSFEGTFGYSIDKDTLTLTEREYGDQIVFERE